MEFVTEWVELKCAKTMLGAPSATKAGAISMPQWLAEQSDLGGVSVVLCKL